jgi:hypothetical protein
MEGMLARIRAVKRNRAGGASLALNTGLGEMLDVLFGAFNRAEVPVVFVDFAVFADGRFAVVAKRMDVSYVPACFAIAGFAFIGSSVNHDCLSRF